MNFFITFIFKYNIRNYHWRYAKNHIIGDMPKTVISDISPMTVFGISPMIISDIIFENEKKIFFLNFQFF